MSEYIYRADPIGEGQYHYTLVGELVRCRDCIHKPHTTDRFNPISPDGFEIIFPDYRCPCQCDDGYYNYMPDDNWYCGNGERRQK